MSFLPNDATNGRKRPRRDPDAAREESAASQTPPSDSSSQDSTDSASTGHDVHDPHRGQHREESRPRSPQRRSRDQDHRDSSRPGSRPRRDQERSARRHLSRREIRERERREAEALRRPLSLTALGTIVPGGGLALTPRRQLGLAVLGLSVVSVIITLLLLWQQGLFPDRGLRSWALELVSHPRVLVALGWAFLLGALIWCGSIVMTALSARRGPMTRIQSGILSAFTGLMCAFVAAPAAVGLYYVNVHQETVQKVFTGKKSGSGGGGTAAPDTGGDDPWANTPRVNILLVGSDGADDREGVRTDSMMVASVDTKTGATVLFGVPRNLQDAPIPEGTSMAKYWENGKYDCGSECLLTYLWSEAEDRAKEDPSNFYGQENPGLTALQDSLAAILGIPIDYTVLMNLDGFPKMVDAMGGVEINVRERTPIGGRMYDGCVGSLDCIIPGTIKNWIEPGKQHLNGYHTMWYARSRIMSNDFNRMDRQRCVVGAILNQVDPWQMLVKYPQLADAIQDSVAVDLSEDELPAFVELVERIQAGGSIRSVTFNPKNINVVDPDLDKVHRTVQRAIEPPKPKKGKGTKPSPKPSPSDEPTTQDPTDPPTTQDPDSTEAQDLDITC